MQTKSGIRVYRDRTPWEVKGDKGLRKWAKSRGLNPRDYYNIFLKSWVLWYKGSSLSAKCQKGHMHIYKGEFSVILSFLPSFLQFIGECEMWSYCFIVILCNPIHPWWFGFEEESFQVCGALFFGERLVGNRFLRVLA